MQGPWDTMMARVARERGLWRIVSELVSYSFFPAVSKKPANNFLYGVQPANVLAS